MHLAAGSPAPPAVSGKLRLYSMRFCPYAQRVHLTLDAKQIPYDVVYINLSNKPKWFQEKSITGEVPCIELENGEVLRESLIIAEYLDNAYPEKKLFPTDPLTLAKDKLLVERFNCVIHPTYKLLSATDRQELFEQALSGLDIYEKELIKRGTPYFHGASPGMVDFMIWPWFERAGIIQVLCGDQFCIPKKRLLRLSEWKSLMEENPAVRKSFLSLEIHAKYMRSRQAGTPLYDLAADS